MPQCTLPAPVVGQTARDERSREPPVEIGVADWTPAGGTPGCSPRMSTEPSSPSTALTAHVPADASTVATQPTSPAAAVGATSDACTSPGGSCDSSSDSDSDDVHTIRRIVKFVPARPVATVAGATSLAIDIESGAAAASAGMSASAGVSASAGASASAAVASADASAAAASASELQMQMQTVMEFLHLERPRAQRLLDLYGTAEAAILSYTATSGASKSEGMTGGTSASAAATNPLVASGGTVAPGEGAELVTPAAGGDVANLESQEQQFCSQHKFDVQAWREMDADARMFLMAEHQWFDEDCSRQTRQAKKRKTGKTSTKRRGTRCCVKIATRGKQTSSQLQKGQPNATL